MEIGWQLFAFAIILTVSSVSAAAGGKCKVCDSNSETKCIKEPGTLPDTTCETNCFTSIDSNGILKRGCLAASDKCEGKSCKSCDAAATACNIQTDFWCKTCDSSANSDCAFWKNENSIPNEFCESGVTKCLMEIKADKHTSRRCATKSDESCPTDRKCDICSSTYGCNKGIFPTDRRTCYQCSSDDSKCATPSKNTDVIKSFPCLFYEESDKCFEHGSSDTSMSRGCLSDTTAYGKCTSESPKDKCKECSTNNCNIDEYKVESSVNCIQCKSDDAKCAGTHTAEEATKCENKIEYWKPQGCYTNKIEAGKVAKGCIQDFLECASTTTCSSCTSGTACNTADAATGKSCYVCRSDDTATCEKPMENNNYPSKPCKNAMSSADTELCYIERWREGGNIVIRNCLADADAKTRKNCLDSNYKYCTTCKTDNCNLGAAPDSAHSIVVASGLLAISLLVLKFF